VLRTDVGLSETDVVRRQLRALAAQAYFDDGA